MVGFILPKVSVLQSPQLSTEEVIQHLVHLRCAILMKDRVSFISMSSI